MSFILTKHFPQFNTEGFFSHAYLVDEQSFRIQGIYKAYKLMYIPSGDTQNDPFFRLQLVVETFKH